jgi:hypothetical protein
MRKKISIVEVEPKPELEPQGGENLAGAGAIQKFRLPHLAPAPGQTQESNTFFIYRKSIL